MRHREFLIAEVALVTALSTSLFTSPENCGSLQKRESCRQSFRAA